MFDKSEEDAINTIEKWGENDPNIRLVILTSSRTRPGAQTDKLSDYDIEVFCDELKLFDNDDWLSQFGTVLVKWPLYPVNTGFMNDSITRLVVFKNFPRVDFQIVNKHNFDEKAYRNGYRVIVDKDQFSRSLPKPTYDEFTIQKPTSEEFYETIDGFYWDLPYIAKSIRRGELAFSIFMLQSAIRYGSFEAMLKWYVGYRGGWKVNYGVHGRNLEKLLDKSFVDKINNLSAVGSPDAIWQSALRMEELFNEMYIEIADTTGYGKAIINSKEILEYCNAILNIDL